MLSRNDTEVKKIYRSRRGARFSNLRFPDIKDAYVAPLLVEGMVPPRYPIQSGSSWLWVIVEAAAASVAA